MSIVVITGSNGLIGFRSILADDGATIRLASLTPRDRLRERNYSERLARQREAALIRVQEFDASPKIRRMYEALRACARGGPQVRSRLAAPRAARSQRAASRCSE
jgi:hypothetical protein